MVVESIGFTFKNNNNNNLRASIAEIEDAGGEQDLEGYNNVKNGNEDGNINL